eukprot:604163-Pelagomonas_calceolata.AAC.1
MAGCKQECEKHWASVLIFILTAWILVEARKKSYTQVRCHRCTKVVHQRLNNFLLPDNGMLKNTLC